MGPRPELLPRSQRVTEIYWASLLLIRAAGCTRLNFSGMVRCGNRLAAARAENARANAD